MEHSRRFLSLMGLSFTICISCVKHVEVSVPPHPSTGLNATEFAVIAQDSHCQITADDLAQSLRLIPGLRVVPQAEVSLHVFSCGETLQPTVDIEAESVQDLHVDRRRLTIEGRSYAVVAVRVKGEAKAHVLGSGRVQQLGRWGDSDLSALSTSAATALHQQLILDLTEQISPLTRVRLRPLRSTQQGAELLYTQAVFAEKAGDRVEALRLAQAAANEKSTLKYTTYVQELTRFLDRRSPTR